MGGEGGELGGVMLEGKEIGVKNKCHRGSCGFRGSATVRREHGGWVAGFRRPDPLPERV